MAVNQLATNNDEEISKVVSAAELIVLRFREQDKAISELNSKVASLEQKIVELEKERRTAATTITK